jgi:hypothetical protein
VALFAGRDRAMLERAVATEQSDVADDRTLGELLGFPPCCIERFLSVAPPRETMALLRAAQCDLRQFHYLSWIPCSFRCEPSMEYARRIEAWLKRRDSAFADRVRAASSASRLLLHPDVQLSMRGTWRGDRFEIESAWPTSRDHHPDVRLSDDAREAVARLQLAVERAGAVERSGAKLSIEGVDPACLRGALLVEFAA